MSSAKKSHKGGQLTYWVLHTAEKSIQQASFWHILHTCVMFGSKVMTFWKIDYFTILKITHTGETARLIKTPTIDVLGKNRK